MVLRKFYQNCQAVLESLLPLTVVFPRNGPSSNTCLAQLPRSLGAAVETLTSMEMDSTSHRAVTETTGQFCQKCDVFCHGKQII